MQLPKLRYDQYLSICCGVFFVILLGIVPRAQQNVPIDRVQIIQKQPILVPTVSADVETPEISAAAAIVIDEASAVTLFEQNSESVFPPASTTKLMTALIARRLYQLDTAIFVPSIVTALDGARAGLVPGEKLSVHNLLQGTLIQSGNDAAVTLAMGHPNGLEGFVSEMNEEAKKLHLSQTSFVNPIGYDAPNHYSSPRDLAILSRKVMLDPVLRQIVGTKQAVITDTSGKMVHPLHSTHQLLGVDPRVIGIKTGTTEEAGEVLITQVNLYNQSILIVVMGSEDRYRDTQALIEYVARSFRWNSVTLNSDMIL